MLNKLLQKLFILSLIFNYLANITICILKNASETLPSIRDVQAAAGTADMLLGQWFATCLLACCVSLIAGRVCSVQTKRHKDGTHFKY